MSSRKKNKSFIKVSFIRIVLFYSKRKALVVYNEERRRRQLDFALRSTGTSFVKIEDTDHKCKVHKLHILFA